MALLLTILLPLLGFALLGLFGKRMREPWPGVLASGLVLASFLLGVGLLLQGGARFQVEWLPGIPFSLLLDNLSGFMLMIVAGVGFLIHVYAIGYMHGDPGYSRFFAYFNLFIAMMLTLVLADSYPVMFIGWEGVGLASFLLIGFWYQNTQYADSARKAFIVNRIGDLGFMLGMAILWALYGTLSISELKEALEGPLKNPSLLALAGLLLFLGAVGKSAQVPLMVWLPDAMAGPTPVSALIHAATMVTAGVYLVARSSFLYSVLPDVSYTIAVIGLLTAFYGALSAFGQNDIKKIVAYSTISQLGYMFLAAGVGAYWVALFHVFTHAFFKALLFLASGSVIHALGGEQDVRKMGGLWKHLPLTRWHGLIGALALGGLPLLSGFWSKDAILTATLTYPFGGVGFYVGALLVAVLTAMYAMRWFVLVFLGEERGHHHPHEAPPVMLWPNHLLALGSVLAGYLALPHPLPNLLMPYLKPALAELEHHHLSLGAEWGLIALSGAVALLGLWLGYTFFQRKALPAWYQAFEAWSRESFYVDRLYNALLVNPLKALAEALFYGDAGLLRGYFGLGGGVRSLGQGAARLQAGYLRVYALLFVVGVLVLLGVMRW
ncbi:MAG: NADH-quinone oxidoreductase subunit L [Thermus sp.]|uniref:NADH-quinone oxidoreductase subunit L n=1 Tax=Thermus sp. TaxID=275 RepID=UPI0025EF9555|nr:NADH-quinone oxidoreductase subunit L [Thermus sp.]MCS6867472.1 NADH-quinone oxidoreductase subunit L [Thermus sp.]MCS7218896.1 NADH-quinone oxidoreductase subunit L [Thermus sp.]MDW8357953.1 NADH-quinone oxidoreductase subunit L [Thermus sp.]